MIYLDNNATTEPLPQVVDAVTRGLREHWGNPSSAHAVGVECRRALESARGSIAAGLGAGHPSEILFTSGGTEAIHAAFALLLTPQVSQILIASTEHSAVFSAAERHAAGRPVYEIPVSEQGVLDLDALDHALRRAHSVVALSLGNNETGVIADVASAAKLCTERRAILHVDAVQAVGKLPTNLTALGCHAASVSAHKFHGPPGAGILYLGHSPRGTTRGMPLLPGHQEAGLRGGTENLPAILGMAAAVEALAGMEERTVGMGRLRDHLERLLLAAVRGSEVHGARVPRLPNTISLYCPERSAADMVLGLSQLGVAVSAGAACSTGGAPSHVIRAMGFSTERANSTLRLSLSRLTTAPEVETAAECFRQAYVTTLPTSRCN